MCCILPGEIIQLSGKGWKHKQFINFQDHEANKFIVLFYLPLPGGKCRKQSKYVNEIQLRKLLKTAVVVGAERRVSV